MVRTLFILTLLVALAPGVGCTVNQNGRWTFWPLAKVSDRVPGITPPPERMRAIREMGQRAARQDPVEQNRLASQLAEMYAQERDPLIRGQIIQSAGYLAGPNTLALLRQGLKDADSDVRVLACQSLGRLGGAGSGRCLGRGPRVRYRPRRPLGGGQSFGRDGRALGHPGLGHGLERAGPCHAVPGRGLAPPSGPGGLR